MPSRGFLLRTLGAVPFAVAIMVATLFVCVEVEDQEAMGDIELGLPIPFVALDARRYTPDVFPQCFALGSPWEDPMRLMPLRAALGVLILSLALSVCASAADGVARRLRRRGRSS